MKADFTVPEQSASQLKLGQAVAFALAEGDWSMAGTIVGIDPRVDPKTRLVSVQAVISDSKGRTILPGQFIRVRVKLAPQPNVLTVPQTAVVSSLYGDYVFVIEADAKDGENRAGRAAGVREGRPQGRRRLGDPVRPDAGPEGRRLRPEQAPVRHGGEDQQQHRRDAAHDPGSAIIPHEPDRTLHPPSRTGDGGEPPHSAARRPGPDEPAGAPVSGGEGDHHHRHDHLCRRQCRADAGLHQHADRQGGLERRGRRLRHLAEPARRQHGVGTHAPQHRPRCRAHRRHRQGAAGPLAASGRCGRPGDRQGHGPDLRPDVSDIRELGDESGAGLRISHPRGPAPFRNAGRRRLGRHSRRPRVRHARLGRSRSPRLAQRDGGRSRQRDPRQQLSVGGGPHQERVRGLLARRADDAADAGGVRRLAGPLERRRHRPPARCGDDRAGSEKHRYDRQLQRQGRHLHRRHADAVSQPAHHGRSRRQGDRADPADPAEGHDRGDRLRRLELHLRLDRGGVQDHRRGRAHRRRRHPAVPWLVPLRADPAGDYPAVTCGRLLRAVCTRLLDQPPDAPGDGARHRPRRRRRHRRAREHPSPYRGGAASRSTRPLLA